MAQNYLFFVVYDSILNSVFDGQILQPILNYYLKDNKVFIISFENDLNNQNLINLKNKIDNINPHLKVILLKRYKYFGKLSLFFNIYKFKNILKNLNSSTNINTIKIIGRGPFAGYIALKALNKLMGDIICPYYLTIQARGLLVEEFKYDNKNKNLNLFTKIINKIREKLYFNLEKAVYNYDIKKLNNLDFNIEAVSLGLKEYLIKNYNSPQELISIANLDFIENFSHEQIETWKNKTRTDINIPQDFIVYCYCGSAKSWQFPQESVEFFKDLLKTNKKIFLLILTQDPEIFKNILDKLKIDPIYYLIKTVEHKDIFKYLACADYGLILREDNILNWVSRPTKALEYKSVGLKIVHNNTVKWLVDNL